MPKPIKWANQAHAIRERVANSTIETWSRQDIEWAFDVKRVAAQELMLSIGGTHTIGSKRFVGRSEIMDFLDAVIKGQSVREVLDRRKVEVGPQPRRKRLRFPIPHDAESYTLLQLPEEIELSPLQIVIRGKDTEELLTNLYLLGQAFLNDAVSMQRAVEPLQRAAGIETVATDDWIERQLHPYMERPES